MQSITYISELSQVYVGLANGTVLSYSDTLPSVQPVTNDEDNTTPNIMTFIEPLGTYKEYNEVCPVILPVPLRNLQKFPQKYDYHLWIGQKDREITVLDAWDLSIVDFVNSPNDKTLCPSYLDQIPFCHLVSSGGLNGKEQSQAGGNSSYIEETEFYDIEPVMVYGALRLGQYISVWDGLTRDLVSCFDLLTLLPQWKGKH